MYLPHICGTTGLVFVCTHGCICEYVRTFHVYVYIYSTMGVCVSVCVYNNILLISSYHSVSWLSRMQSPPYLKSYDLLQWSHTPWKCLLHQAHSYHNASLCPSWEPVLVLQADLVVIFLRYHRCFFVKSVEMLLRSTNLKF